MLILSSAPVSALLFVVSLLIAMGASSWFTRRLENICNLLELPDSLLSLLGALGANIPNYAASIVAIAHGQMAEGLGIIIGSNIYNIAIILSVSTFAHSFHHSIRLGKRQAADALIVGIYTLAISCATLGSVALLTVFPAHTFAISLYSPISIVLIVVSIVALAFFGRLCYHALNRPAHIVHEPSAPSGEIIKERRRAEISSVRAFGGAILALLTALGSVVVMVNAGQTFATDIHMPPAILGLLVLAVATSLPNTVVAFILARTGRETACVEEVLSSNSINAALGIALPLIVWHSMIHDTLLLALDVPLMIALTLVMLGCVLRQRVRHVTAVLLFCVYVAWIVTHLYL
ncbi:MAG TPA: hypothetical protein DHW02_11455 [Ktedonobacter sp.]|nr:hypothetical protein [Ktedonobacter sp.]